MYGLLDLALQHDDFLMLFYHQDLYCVALNCVCLNLQDLQNIMERASSRPLLMQQAELKK